MPRSKQHKENSRQRILSAAYQLFTQYGYVQVTIDQIMNTAGLTRGAFYNHFDTKSDVYQHAFHFGARQQVFYNMIKDSPLGDKETLEKAIIHYLSSDHVNGDLPGCPLSFLNTDAATSQPEVRQLYTDVFANVCKTLNEH